MIYIDSMADKALEKLYLFFVLTDWDKSFIICFLL